VHPLASQVLALQLELEFKGAAGIAAAKATTKSKTTKGLLIC
jgi:hypothetical protein